jgi:uncharacterized membrane protein YphA (DoxX/SURF4 family)
MGGWATTAGADRRIRTAPPAPPAPRAPRVVSTLLRLGLAGVWIAAGTLKVDDPAGMVRSVRAFRLLPESLVHPVAYAVPFVEIALGALLLVGLAIRFGAVVSALLLAAYIAAIASAAARGLRIDCGCFSNGGDVTAGAPTHYTSELVRDSLLLAAGVLLAVLPAGYLAADGLLDRSTLNHSRRADGLEAEEDTDEDVEESTDEDTDVDRERQQRGPSHRDG